MACALLERLCVQLAFAWTVCTMSKGKVITFQALSVNLSRKHILRSPKSHDSPWCRWVKKITVMLSMKTGINTESFPQESKGQHKTGNTTQQTSGLLKENWRHCTGSDLLWNCGKMCNSYQQILSRDRCGSRVYFLRVRSEWLVQCTGEVYWSSPSINLSSLPHIFPKNYFH